MNIKGLSLFAFAIIFLSIFTLSIAADPIVREASGATPASIQAAVDQFRADLGAAQPKHETDVFDGPTRDKLGRRA